MPHRLFYQEQIWMSKIRLDANAYLNIPQNKKCKRNYISDILCFVFLDIPE